MRVFNILMLMMLSFFANAENAAEDLFYSHGKIYVVVAILLIIFISIIVYLWRLDSKVKKLEDKNEA